MLQMDQTTSFTGMTNFSYLALGDSYTVGESVLPEENFPSQAVERLNKNSNDNDQQHFSAPQIIARTGWTTDELDAAIDAAGITTNYDIVSLLIGVNNQYRGRSANEYKIQFDHLLQRAIHFAGNNAQHVFVLSIPDWGVTPFAEGQDREKIATAINAYNAAAKDICEQHHIVFIDITSAQRADGNKKDFLVVDGLHPSGKEYTKWAIKLADAVKKNLAG